MKKILLKNQNEKRAGFQPQTQSISVTTNPQINNTETLEKISSTKVTGISIPTTSILKPGLTIPLQVPKKTFQSISDNHKYHKRSEKFTSQKISSGLTSHQFQVWNATTIPFS